MGGSPSEKRCHSHTCLLDLSADCLRLVLRQLRPRDVCTLATTCSRLAEVASEVRSDQVLHIEGMRATRWRHGGCTVCAAAAPPALYLPHAIP
jgi:F-box domain